MEPWASTLILLTSKRTFSDLPPRPVAGHGSPAPTRLGCHRGARMLPPPLQSLLPKRLCEIAVPGAEEGLCRGGVERAREEEALA